MYHQEAFAQYAKALKQGRRYYKDCVLRGDHPYPQVLDEILARTVTAGTVNVGIIDIPTEQIVGIKTAGRKTAFAGNFMPLLDEDSEFAHKWISLCNDHLGDEGIREPITCYEYLGRFYVQEGNKRVSVLKSFDAPVIPGNVIRILPVWSEDPEIQIYYEFLSFYQLSGLYQVQFRRSGCYAKLQAALGFSPDHVWSREERRSFLTGFSYFKTAFQKLGGEELSITPAGALLIWLEVYPFSDLKEKSATELNKSISALWPDFKSISLNVPAQLSTAPEEPEKTLMSRFFAPLLSHLNVAFIYNHDPRKSRWTRGHELGRRYLEDQLGSKVSVRVYHCDNATAAEVMEQAATEGADVIFSTTPQIIDACRKVAADHPTIKVLSCSPTLPYTGVRTYYSRLYEAKFIIGAIAGAMSPDDTIGYVANYPIFGVPACINAFALGAQLTNPKARIRLEWSCLPGSATKTLQSNHISVISNRDVSAPDYSYHSWEWGVYQTQTDGQLLPLASPCWDWGKFYVQVVESIFSGAWDMLGSRSSESPVSYWWGMSSGAIDVQLSDTLPTGVRQLADILKAGIISGSINPFQRRITDQSGTLRNDGTKRLTPEEIIGMDWLCDGVDGTIPPFEALRPQSQQLVRLLGVYRDAIPPEKEAAQL